MPEKKGISHPPWWQKITVMWMIPQRAKAAKRWLQNDQNGHLATKSAAENAPGASPASVFDHSLHVRRQSAR